MVNEAEGILEPGKQFSATYVVTNTGSVAARDLEVTVGGGNVASEQKQAISIGALRSERFIAHNIGTLIGELKNGQDIDVTLHVGNQSSSLEEQVRYTLAVQHPKQQVDYLNGSGAVTSSISNISNAKAYGEAVATLYVDSQKIESKNLGIMNAARSQIRKFLVCGSGSLSFNCWRTLGNRYGHDQRKRAGSHASFTRCRCNSENLGLDHLF